MGEFGPDDEILEFAISREVEAYQLYMTLASRVKKVGMRKVFEDLAKEELEHKAKLELELMKIGKTVPISQELPGPESDYDDDSLLEMDYKDMLTLGMEKEETSFRTYIDLLPSIHNQQSRELLLALAEEEVKHKIRFENEYEMLLKDS